MPKFAELQILLDAGMNLTKFDNFNCQEYEVAGLRMENGEVKRAIINMLIVHIMQSLKLTAIL